MNGQPQGLLLLDKPEGVTSHTAVALAARALYADKAGHAGTLDPMATGLLLVGVGRATRLLEHIVGLDKTYQAVVRLGVQTTTLDREGETVETRPVGEIGRETLLETFARFTGEIVQKPPVHSAIKVGGVPLHRRVRRGEDVEAPERTVTIKRLELKEAPLPDLSIEVECTSGTYIRSLARDLGLALGTGGTLWALRRTRCGDFRVEDAVDLYSLQNLSPEEASALLLDPLSMTASLPRITLTEDELAKIHNGVSVMRPEPPQDAEDAALLSPGGSLAAIARIEGGLIRPRKVFLDTPPQVVV